MNIRKRVQRTIDTIARLADSLEVTKNELVTAKALEVESRFYVELRRLEVILEEASTQIARVKLELYKE